MTERNPPPFDPGSDFDAIADFVRVEVAKVALRVSKHARYKRASLSDRTEAYIAGMMVGAYGAIIAITNDESDLVDLRAVLRKHADYWFDVGALLNKRPMLGELDG